MVGFHMLNYQIIGGAAVEDALDVVQPAVNKAGIDGVHNGDFLVNNNVGVICHAVGNNILSLKKIDLVIVDANVLDTGSDIHIHPPKEV